MNATDALVPFGFTALESQIYGFLLGESPATGYRIAQGINKPVANVYKAIESLAGKQAVIVEASKSRECRPVAAEELFARLQREFESNQKAAKEALSKASGKGEREPLYPVRSRTDLTNRAVEAVQAAEKSIVVQSTKGALAPLETALRAAIARGVSVAVQSDSAVGLDAATSIGPMSSEDTIACWPGELLCVSVDGSVFAFGLVDRWGNVVQGLHGRSKLVALLLHEGMAAGICLAELHEKIEEGAGTKRLNRTLAGMRRASGTPGFQALSDEMI